MKKHIMAIGAHIGDAELTCGKTLATHFLKGDDITTVAVTAGERGAPPDRDIKEFKQHNIDCATAFAKALGGNHICMNIPDGETEDNEELRRNIAKIIRECKPDVILTHWEHGMHKDHRITARAVKDAVYYASLRDYEIDGLPRHGLTGGLYYAENWEDPIGFEPYVFIDVSAGYDLWHTEIQKLWLTNNSPWFKYLQHYVGLSAVRGALIRKERAECFAVEPYARRIVKDGF